MRASGKDGPSILDGTKELSLDDWCAAQALVWASAQHAAARPPWTSLSLTNVFLRAAWSTS